MRKQGSTARGLPFERTAKRVGVHADQQQIALACKMFCGGLGDLAAVEKWMKLSRRSISEPWNTPARSASRHKAAGQILYSVCMVPVVYVGGLPTIIE